MLVEKNVEIYLNKMFKILESAWTVFFLSILPKTCKKIQEYRQ